MENEHDFVSEIQILREITEAIKCSAELSNQENGYIVDFIDWFEYEEPSIEDEFDDLSNNDTAKVKKTHLCFVMEPLGHSVYKLLLRYAPRINDRKAVPVPIVI